ncbi:MAG: hypothetical protein KAX33_07730, partial [Candidatus Lokiarchaeota archaeon]|nr:hypothetical protein [Candidatus Lokiarchaeota archaeon]
MEEENEIKKQMLYYFTFAALMIGLNYLIQKINQIWLAPFICANLSEINLIQTLYCSTDPYNMPELVGSIIA